jgi:uncharacterized protein (TIGR00297 family)
LLAGAAVAAIISALAFRARLLSLTGAVAATALGALAVGAGWSWGILLVVFFTLTSAVSAYGAERKRALTRDVIEKGATRDAAQVLSNGGVFSAAAVLWVTTSDPLWIAAGAGAIAAASADSWATEVGVALGGEPRLITSGRTIPRGTSGGVTVAGMLGALIGSAVIAGTMLIIDWPLFAAPAAFLAGVTGMILDSVLGATLQARRLCPDCGTETEQKVHRCGARTRVIRGLAWMNNDAVNAAATLAGAAAAGIIFSAIR